MGFSWVLSTGSGSVVPRLAAPHPFGNTPSSTPVLLMEWQPYAPKDPPPKRRKVTADSFSKQDFTLAEREALADLANKPKEEQERTLRGMISVPRCPICGSTSLRKMSTLTGMLEAGFAGAAKRHQCYSCSHLF